eukprot:1149248-Pelagomonas_calceolata.AAC.5
MAGAAGMARTQLWMHACVNKTRSAAGTSCCCPRHCMSMPTLCQEGQASPTFQRRLQSFPHLIAKRYESAS